MIREEEKEKNKNGETNFVQLLPDFFVVFHCSVLLQNADQSSNTIVFFVNYSLLSFTALRGSKKKIGDPSVSPKTNL